MEKVLKEKKKREREREKESIVKNWTVIQKWYLQGGEMR